MADPDAPISLRQLADRLVQRHIAQRSDKRGYDTLLSLLKTGQLRAVVFFPAISNQALWIPRSYWQPRGPDAMQCLRLIRRRRCSGSYKIRLGDIANEAFAAMTQVEQGGGEIRTSRAHEIALLLVQRSDDVSEVAVLESEWKAFSADRGIEEAVIDYHQPDYGEKRGKKRKRSWEYVLIELAAILWSSLEKNDIKLPKHKSIADEIWNNLRQQNISDLPKATTILAEMNIVRRRVDALQDPDVPLKSKPD